MMDTPLIYATKKSSGLILGTWALGGGKDWGQMSAVQSAQTLQAAVEAGICVLDTSPVYGWGAAEERIGQTLGKIRSRLFLAGKCGICLNAQNRPDHNLQPRSIVAECEASLKRLQTDYLDLYQIHWPDPNTALEQSLEALVRLKEQGKIRYIGVCNFTAEALKQAVSLAPIDCVQNQLSLLAPFPAEILDFCREKKIDFWGYGLLGGGILSGKYTQEPNFRRGDARKYFYPYYTAERFWQAQQTVQRLQEIARRKNTTCAAVSLAWGLAQTAVSGVLFGAKSPQQVQENRAALAVELTETEKEFLQHG